MVSMPSGNFVHTLSDSASSLTPLLEQQASHAPACLLSQHEGNNKMAALLRSNSLAHSSPVATATCGWPHVSDPQLLSLFATAGAAAPMSAPPQLHELRVSSQAASPIPGQYSDMYSQQPDPNQWAVHNTSEPPQTAVLAALQSIQLKLQVQEQAVEFQTLEKQNQYLISNLLTAQQRIQELQAEVALLQHTMEKVEAATRLNLEEQRAREQALQQRHSQLTNNNMEAEIAIQQLETSLAEAKKKQKELNYSNIMLSLGFSLTAPTGKGGRSNNSSYANRKCYNCGQKGHRASDCPNPRTRPDAAGEGGRSTPSKTGSDVSCNSSETHGSPKFPASPVKPGSHTMLSPAKFPSTPAKVASTATPMATHSPAKTKSPASPVKTPAAKSAATPDSPMKAPSTPDAAVLVSTTARAAAVASPPGSPPQSARHHSHCTSHHTGNSNKPGSPSNTKSGKKKAGNKSRSRTPSPAGSPAGSYNSSPTKAARKNSPSKGQAAAAGVVTAPMTPPASCKAAGAPATPL